MGGSALRGGAYPLYTLYNSNASLRCICLGRFRLFFFFIFAPTTCSPVCHGIISTLDRINTGHTQSVPFNAHEYPYERVRCGVYILCALTAAADSKKHPYNPHYVYIQRRRAIGRRCSSRNRLGEQNPGETKTDRIIIIIIEKKR